MNRQVTIILLVLCITTRTVYGRSDQEGGQCTVGQPPRFTLEPQDAVLPLSRDGNPLGAFIHCAHEPPDTNLTWFRESEKIVSGGTRTIHPNGTLEFTFLIDNFDLSASGVKYHCMLSNAFGSVISRTSILQSTSFDDGWDRTTPGNTPVDVTLGSSILLPCDPPAANPSAEVVWLSNGAVLDTAANENKYKILASGGGLIIGNVAATDIGPTYRCRVTNVNLYASKDSPLTYTLNQIGRYTENLTIYDTLQDVYLLALGSTAEFTCLAIANDANNLEYFYRRTNGNRIGSNVVRPTHDGPTVDGRTTMHINGITAANDGEYECLVRDISSGGDSIILGRSRFNITVTFPPAITSVPSNQILYTGDTHTFTCGASGVPAPTISYYFNAALITTGVSDGVLTLTGVTNDTNTGPYQCFADNVRPDSSPSWVVTVRYPSSPRLLAQSDVNDTVTMDSDVTLTVDVSADPEPTAVWLLNGGDLASTSFDSVNVLDDTACPKTYQVQLIVVEFNEIHSGRYTVAISNRAGMLTFNFDRNLESAIIEGPSNVTYLPGLTPLPIELTCNVTGFVIWRVNGTDYTLADLNNGALPGHSHNGTNILVNSPVNNTEYICVSLTNDGETSSDPAYIITVGVPEKVPSVTVNVMSINGDNVTLTLSWGETFNNFEPIVHYTVSCSGDVTCPPNFTTTDNTTRSYSITNLTPMTNYIFSVVATNSIGSGEAGVLILTTPPVTPTISPEVMDRVQDERGTASFTCSATGQPLPTISWYFNSVPINESNTMKYTISVTLLNTTTISSTLTIMNVESSDVGTYTCNATNVASTDISAGILTVNVAPTIITSMQRQQFNITEERNGSITCTATGYPVPTVVWQNSDGSSLSNNRLVSGSPVNISSTGVGNVTSVSVELMVIRAMRVDTGMYRCSANNNVNSTTRNITITVQ